MWRRFPRFAEDFDREMQAAYFNFQTAASDGESRPRRKIQRSVTTLDDPEPRIPELISDLYFLGKDRPER